MSVTSNNISLDIKRTFLNFAQALFTFDHVYTWDEDVQKTKLFIVDNFSIDTGIIGQRPAIVLNRGPISWAYAVKGQDATNVAYGINERPAVASLNYSDKTSDPSNFKTYVDLIQGYITYKVISKNGVECDILANKLFQTLTASKSEFRKLGFVKLSNLTISQEQLLKSSSTPELFGIDVSIAFQRQVYVVMDEKTYNCYLYDGDKELFEKQDFYVENNGTTIRVKIEPDNQLLLNYTDSITLTKKENIILTNNDNSLNYTIPDNGSILGYYLLNSGIEAIND